MRTLFLWLCGLLFITACGPFKTSIGSSCSAANTFSTVEDGLAVCRDGSWHYALPSDVPPGPYPTRPDWYPTLDKVFGQPESTCPSTQIQLTHTILPLDQLTASIPYGMMVGGHVTPIDHGYLGIKTLAATSPLSDADFQPITAPADGTIIEVSALGDPNSHRVVIAHGCGLYSVYMVVNKLTGVLAAQADAVKTQSYLQLNQPIKAGEEFGRQRDNPLDFNLFAKETWLTGFVSPLSYLYGESWKLYTTDPTPYFSAELQKPYTDIMQRTTAPRWGKIDYDVAGSAAGNWFLAETLGYNGIKIDTYKNATQPIQSGMGTGTNNYWYGHLALVPHHVQPDSWMASFGGWQDPKGDGIQQMIALAPNQKTPDQITATDGVVVYQLASMQYLDASGTPLVMQGGKAPQPVGYTIAPGQPNGAIAVQVEADGTLSIEVFPDTLASTIKGFGGNKRSYHR
ncbi:MAG: hypothetical protein NT020_02745 [Chloroflexales bacterium]|nr:hypothetical protein [Chloroflexales bacterium]